MIDCVESFCCRSGLGIFEMGVFVFKEEVCGVVVVFKII